MNEQAGTLSQIIEVAQQLMHVRGYNSFSYANISEAVGIKKASIHYYFPNKSDLVREVVAQHRAAFQVELAQIDRQTTDPCYKLTLYVQHYSNALHNADQMCLCGMLAADFPTLPALVQAEVQGFFADNEAWLSSVLRAGHALGVLQVNEPVEVEAQLLIAGVEGAMLVARANGDVQRFRLIVQRLLDRLASAEKTKVLAK